MGDAVELETVTGTGTGTETWNGIRIEAGLGAGIGIGVGVGVGVGVGSEVELNADARRETVGWGERDERACALAQALHRMSVCNTNQRFRADTIPTLVAQVAHSTTMEFHRRRSVGQALRC
jgi:hypothetical protein